MKRLLISIIAIALVFTPAVEALAQNTTKPEARLLYTASVPSANAGDEFTVDVNVQNPKGVKVISVRAWLEYNPNALEALGMENDDSGFSLVAPGEDKIEKDQQLIKIGRSNIEGGMTQNEALVARVRFRVTTQTPITTVIRAHDFRISELGHTSVNIVDGGLPVNLLSKKPDDLLIPLNGGNATKPPSAPSGPSAGGEVGGGAIFQPPVLPLSRPTGLAANPYESSVQLRWNLGPEPHLVGYYIYYGKTSGLYTRRRPVGRVTEAVLEELTRGDVYYIAITAHDSTLRESDYSDEVAFIAGEPLSSTSPFEELLNSLLASLPAQPQNGPLAWWLAFSAAGLSILLVFGRRRKQTPS